MGASIGNAIGVVKAVSEEERKKVVAVIGDSTFLHSGITGLLNVVYNRVRLRLSTHDAGGITAKDFDLAKRIETVSPDYSRKIRE